MNHPIQKEVRIPVGKLSLKGDLFIPEKARALIIFSHGSGSSRLSPRNRMVASYLHQRNFGTLLFDLLTGEEDQQFRNRFDIELLTRRLVSATEWLEGESFCKDCSLGYFGASTGAASAIRAAGYLGRIGAVVSRGGRPDLAGKAALAKLGSPTLLLVGSLDYDVILMNEWAANHMECERALTIVPGASHLFEEKGTMEKVCELATRWFKKHLFTVKAG